MSPHHYIKLSLVLLVASVALEITLLAGLFRLSDVCYHGIHLLLIAVLVASQLTLFLTADKQYAGLKYAFWFALATTFTAVGDYVNSALSAVQPVALKLTWALFLFGAGYAIYCFAFWQFNKASLQQPRKSRFSGLQYLVALPILLVNILSWLQHVELLLHGMAVLYYGSFVFNATIYVMMPLFAIWFFHSSKYSTGSLLVLLGALLIPYSDLVLFATWLPNNPAVPSFQYYSYNWILYFSGQALITQFPAWVMTAEHQANVA